MTTPSWPFGLPAAPLVAGYTEQRQDGAVRFQPEVGPPKVRRRNTGVAKQLSMTLLLSAVERELLDGFYEDELAGGTLAFTWRDPGDGAGTYQFVGPPQFSMVDPDNWNASFQLLRLA